VSRKVIGSDKPWVKDIAFSLGVVADGPLLFTAGITARDPEGKVVGAGDMRAQIEQCFKNIGDVLRAAGAGYGDVLKWTMYTGAPAISASAMARETASASAVVGRVSA